MPGLVNGDGVSRKRKSDSQTITRTTSKRRAVEKDTPGDDDPQAQILLLENQIVDSRRHYNNIAKLLTILRTPDREEDGNLAAAVSLCRVFSRLAAAGSLSTSKDAPENEVVIVAWLKERYEEYTGILLGLLEKGSLTRQTTALTLLLRMLKVEASYASVGQARTWKTGLFAKVLQALLAAESGQDVREEFAAKYVEVYDDIRFYTFMNVA